MVAFFFVSFFLAKQKERKIKALSNAYFCSWNMAYSQNLSIRSIKIRSKNVSSVTIAFLSSYILLSISHKSTNEKTLYVRFIYSIHHFNSGSSRIIRLGKTNRRFSFGHNCFVVGDRSAREFVHDWRFSGNRRF